MFSDSQKVIATIGVMVILAIGLVSLLFSSPAAESKEDKLQQITSELKSLVSSSNSGITNTVSQAVNDKQEAENQMIAIQNTISVMDKCIEVNTEAMNYNNNLTIEQFLSGGVRSPVSCESIKIDEPPTSGTATGAINPVASRLLSPSQLFFTAKVTDHCYVSQTPAQHYKANRRLAWDVVCDFGGEKIGQFMLYAPDYKNASQDYTVSDVYTSQDTGNTIDLTFGNKRWTIGHVETKLKKGDSIKTGQVIGRTNLSGVTSGHHSHIELWVEGVNTEYSTYSKKLDTFRKTPAPTVPYGWGSTYYFTAYNLGSIAQNDSAPCIGASGKNLCEMEKQGIRTIALTRDVRDSLGLNLGDKVKLEGPCGGVYQVEDEMNCRFRGKPCWYKKDGQWKYHPTGNILRDDTSLYIKGDIPSCGGGAHKILPI